MAFNLKNIRSFGIQFNIKYDYSTRNPKFRRKIPQTTLVPVFFGNVGAVLFLRDEGNACLFHGESAYDGGRQGESSIWCHTSFCLRFYLHRRDFCRQDPGLSKVVVLGRLTHDYRKFNPFNQSKRVLFPWS